MYKLTCSIQVSGEQSKGGGSTACAFACLSATALGLASVWVGSFIDEGVRRAIGVSDRVLPVALLPIGYPGDKPDRRGRRPQSELVHELGD